MGINGLWQAIAPAAHHRSFAEFLTSEAVERTSNGESLPVIGVDASPLMFEAQGAAIRARKKGGSLARIGRNVEYSTLMKFLEQFIRAPCIVHIVFDGGARPVRKRNRAVGQGLGQEHYLAGGFRALLDAFGFHWSIAPGEGEAQLAHMNRAGIIDFVFTSDSDIFLFGAVRVIRRPQMKENRDHIEVYTSDALEDQDSGALSRSGILFLAVVAGGDYNTTGLRGCGFDTAYTLAQSTELPQLLNAAISTEASFGNRLSAAHGIPESFPDPGIVHQYANSITDVGPNLAAKRDVNLPDTDRLVRAACDILEWRWARTYEMLKSSAWPGHCMRQILEMKQNGITSHMSDTDYYSKANGLGGKAIRAILKITTTSHPGASGVFKYCRLETWIQSVNVPAIQAYEEVMRCDIGPSAKFRTSATLWIPGKIINYVHPELVAQFFHDEACRQAPPRRGTKRAASASPPRTPSSHERRNLKVHVTEVYDARLGKIVLDLCTDDEESD
ncbi:PIN domain-like protein [Ephemerocybe angulata]|uniref:PIN domain-like protein n=1 Tax=Ephemerocybe angulata TaxID=980116 RepID=A0A8H6IE34_9AGAR|nr:PIN domain-like protein [Tulosesus angulatus]